MVGITDKKKKIRTRRHFLTFGGQIPAPFAAIMFALLGLSLISTLGVLWLARNTGAIASKDPPSLVQLSDGSTIAVGALEGNERTPETIKTFVGTTLTGLFSWDGLIPGELTESGSEEIDPGITVDRSKKVTTLAWHRAFALSEVDGFRQKFLERLAELTPQRIFSRTGQVQVILLPREISTPETAGEGKWKVHVVANLTTFEGDLKGETIPFNKTVYVRAIDTPPLPKPGATALQRIAFDARSKGLEIYLITNLERGLENVEIE